MKCLNSPLDLKTYHWLSNQLTRITKMAGVRTETKTFDTQGRVVSVSYSYSHPAQPAQPPQPKREMSFAEQLYASEDPRLRAQRLAAERRCVEQQAHHGVPFVLRADGRPDLLMMPQYPPAWVSVPIQGGGNSMARGIGISARRGW